MIVQRYDYSPIQARKTDEGFLVDSPIVARTGIQEYRNADGSPRFELRLPEEVFNTDALSSMKGKPITVDHPKTGKVDSKTSYRLSIGTVLSSGVQDGDNVVADIVIHSPDAIGDRRELSLGYTADLEETPGVWNGQKYDAIQRNIKVNHLSVVKRGRAGVARLNMDSNEDFPTTQQEHQTMSNVKIKLDNGLEYEAAPEVSVALDKLRSDALEFAKKLEAIPKLQDERDTLQAKVDGFKDELEKAKSQGRIDALERMKLEETAGKFKVEFSGKTDRDIKEAVIKSVRKDAVLTDKSDVYIDAAFDMATEIAPDFNMASQRHSANTHTDSAVTDGKSAYEKYMKALANKGDK